MGSDWGRNAFSYRKRARKDLAPIEVTIIIVNLWCLARFWTNICTNMMLISQKHFEIIVISPILESKIGSGKLTTGPRSHFN